MSGEVPDPQLARIHTTPPPHSLGWCAWCQDRLGVGQLTLVDDTGVPIPGPNSPTGGLPMCGICGWRFHGSVSDRCEGTYVFDAEET